MTGMSRHRLAGSLAAGQERAPTQTVPNDPASNVVSRFKRLRIPHEAVCLSPAFLFFVAIPIASTVSTLSTSSTSTLSTLYASSLENSATYDLVSLARVLPLPHVQERNAGERGRYVTGSHIPPQVEQVVSRAAVSQGIRIVGFRTLWPLAGVQLTGKCCHE